MLALVVSSLLLAQPPAGARDLGLLEETLAQQRLGAGATEARPCLDTLRRHVATGLLGTLSPDQVRQLLEGHVRACVEESPGRAAGARIRSGPTLEAVLAAAEQGLRSLDEAIASQQLAAEEAADAGPCLNAMRPQLAAGLLVDLPPDQARERVDGFVRPCVSQTRARLASLQARREELEAHQAIARAERDAEEAVQDYARTHPEVRVDYHSWQRCLALVELETAIAARRRGLQRGGLPKAAQEELAAAVQAARARRDGAQAALTALEARPEACGSRALKRFEACLVQEPPSVPCAAAQWLQQHGGDPEGR